MRFPWSRDDDDFQPLDTEELRLVKACVEQVRTTWTVKATDLQCVKDLLAMPESRHPDLVAACLAVMRDVPRMPGGGYNATLPRIASEIIVPLLKRKPNVSDELMRALLHHSRTTYWEVPIKSLLAILESQKRDQFPDAIRKELDLYVSERLRGSFGKPNKEDRDLTERIRLMLGGAPKESQIPKLRWIDEMLAANPDASFCELLEHCAVAKDTQAWAKEAERILKRVDKQALFASISRALHLIRDQSVVVIPEGGDVLKGLCKCLGMLPEQRSVELLGESCLICLKKLYGVGPKSLKGANASISALGQMGTFEALAELSRLRGKVRYLKSAELLLRTLEEAAERQGTTIEELEEIVVPTYGFESDGLMREDVYGARAIYEITGSTSVSFKWESGGKLQKSAPPAVPKEDAKESSALAKDIEKTLAGQRLRLERLMLSQREIQFEAWRERYVEHPLLGHMSRRLIWATAEATFVYTDGTVAAANGEKLKTQNNDLVRLWHPIHSSASEVASWREWLFKRKIAQPFKQAFREIYALTESERVQGFSHRFAGHVLRQHPLAALCRQRDWRYHLQSESFDGSNDPSLKIPGTPYIAFLETDLPIGGRHAESGISFYILTRDVRVRMGNGTSSTLLDLTPLQISEIFRDVDLFVSVCSVGNDATWTFHDWEEGRKAWELFSIGELLQSAESRKPVLDRLLKDFKLSDNCRIEGRYLIVKGTLRNYKIHLGSGTVLMSPNDQMLSVIPDRFLKRAEGVFLPFEGDSTLGLILAKAMLLAEDANIKDEGLLKQIRL